MQKLKLRHKIAMEGLLQKFILEGITYKLVFDNNEFLRSLQSLTNKAQIYISKIAL